MSKKRVVSMLLAMGLVMSLFVSAMSVSAFHEEPEGGEIDGDASSAHSYFPWVPNANEIDGMGEYTGAVTIQNVESEEAEVDLFVGTGDGWDLVETVTLAAHESITLSADQLDVPAPGASVVAAGYVDRGEDETTETVTCGEIADPPGFGEAYDAGCDVVFNPDTNQRELVDEGQEVEIDVAAENAVYASIAGVVKNVSPTGGSVVTTADDTSVDGYSGLTGIQVSQDLIEELTEVESDGTYVLPIVQTNSGWNTHLRVANMSESGGLTNVTVTLYGSGTQGYAGESEVINLQLRAGQVESIDLSDYVEEGWVGSAYITSNADIAAVAERYKVDDQMLISNTTQPEVPSDWATEVLGEDDEYRVFGALVFKEYNFWNTGISVANTDPNNTNNVVITYYGPTGNEVGQDTLTIPPRGQEYVYTPGTQDLGLTDGFVGSVTIDGTSPLHATIDQVKYFGEGGDVGHAMSYAPTHWLDSAWVPGDTLSMPLVQKGNPVTGGGDTSGIQLYNSSQEVSATAEITFYGANGLPVAPTVENNAKDPIQITLGPNQSYTLYSHDQSELSSGFQGSVVVERTNFDDSPFGGLVGVSNNVNYDVDGDGSVAYPMVLGLNFANGEVSLDQRSVE